MPVLRVVSSGQSIALLDPISGSRLRVIVEPAEPEEEDVMLSATVTLTDAQIKALPTTPVEILAAPGANKLIVPFTIVCHHKWVTDYNGMDSDTHFVVDISGTMMAALHNNDLGGVSNLLAGGDPSWVFITLNQLAAAKATTATPAVDLHFHQGAVDSGWFDMDIVNKPLMAYMENAGGDLGGGNAGNTLDIIVFYVVVDA